MAKSTSKTQFETLAAAAHRNLDNEHIILNSTFWVASVVSGRKGGTTITGDFISIPTDANKDKPQTIIDKRVTLHFPVDITASAKKMAGQIVNIAECSIYCDEEGNPKFGNIVAVRIKRIALMSTSIATRLAKNSFLCDEDENLTNLSGRIACVEERNDPLAVAICNAFDARSVGLITRIPLELSPKPLPKKPMDEEGSPANFPPAFFDSIEARAFERRPTIFLFDTTPVAGIMGTQENAAAAYAAMIASAEASLRAELPPPKNEIELKP